MGPTTRLSLSLIVFLMAGAQVVYGQNPPRNLGSGSSGFPPQEQIANDSFGFGEVIPDTSHLFVYHLEDPVILYPLSDTLLGSDLYQYDPIRQVRPNYAHLGNVGSPHHPIAYQAPDRQGFALGFHHLDLYRMPVDRFPFYQVEQAFTRAYFSQGPNQQNTFVKAEFSRNFDGRVNLSLYLRRMNNLGAYLHQNALVNTFGLGLHHYSKDERYQVYVNYLSNSSEQEANGGITDIERTQNLIDTLIPPALIDVNILTGESRFATNSYALTQYYQLRAASDSTNANRRALQVGHQFQYDRTSFKYADESPSADGSFYNLFQVDDRGIRHFLIHKEVRNKVNVSTFKMGPPDSLGVRDRKDLLEAGIVHRLHTLEQEPTDTVFNNLFLYGRWELNSIPFIRVSAEAHYGLLANRGDSKLAGKLQLELQKAGRIEFHAGNEVVSPNLMQQRLFVSQQLIWDTELNKTITSQLGSTYLLPEKNIEAGFTYSLINNLIYFDQNAFVQQTGVPVSLFKIHGHLRLKAWKFYLDNWVFLQQATEPELRMPPLYSTHSLYFEGKIFKQVMLAKIGIDLRLVAPFDPYGFQPVTGQFFLQGEQRLNWQPIADAFIAFKVRKFRFFFRLENALPLLTNQYHYLIAEHPIPQTGIRFGLSWQFVD